MTLDEATPLLGGGKHAARRILAGPTAVLVAGFLVSVALSFTQVPILYAFRLMECEAFYQSHPPYDGTGDRCSRNEIDAGTAEQVSLLGLLTMTFGTLNLFFTGWQIKTWGPRTALVVQTFFPAIRQAIQVIGVKIGAQTGILLLQLSQIIGLVGGSSGYLLVLNTAAAEVVAPSERTAMFGKLQGSVMLGTAIGYLLGGVTGDTLGIRRPFEISLVLFALSSVYARAFVPYIDPTSLTDESAKAKGIKAIFGPLKVLGPQKLRLQDGRVTSHFGITFLALGIFMGVLATGYAPILIQLYATAAFGFRPSENGYLMATNCLIRGFFLIFVFPRIISSGREWFSSGAAPTDPFDASDSLPTDPADFDPVPAPLTEQEPTKPPNPVEDEGARAFDLFFLRWSLVADGLVTAYTASATQGWHIYIAGFLLPLASGSAPASKGVITEMCAPAERADALQAMTLVESFAMMSTLGLFGYIFSAFSDIGKSYLTFYCNAAVALVAVIILLFSHVLPPNSTFENEADMADMKDALFEIYDLRVEAVCPEGEKILCGAKPGDYFTLEGEMMYLPPGQGISIYSLADGAASVLPMLAAKQRVTHPHDWMTTDALIACPDPNCKSKLKITRTGTRTFRHSDTTVVGLEGNA
ncbi:MFS general substrate transporter [Thozetella sp. PMI_491]|nr:MFS general substrate transporter [Thozetella sp. PMI_491]